VHEDFNRLFKLCAAVRLKLPFLMREYYYTLRELLPVDSYANDLQRLWLYIDWDTTVVPSCDLTEDARIHEIFWGSVVQRGKQPSLRRLLSIQSPPLQLPQAPWGFSIDEEDPAGTGRGWYSYHDVPVLGRGATSGILAVHARFPLPSDAPLSRRTIARPAFGATAAAFPVLTEYWRVVTDIVRSGGYSGYAPVTTRHTYTDRSYGLRLGEKDIINILALVTTFDAAADAAAAAAAQENTTSSPATTSAPLLRRVL
jgi:hypothetical protein